MRHSIAWPRSATSSWVNDSGSPAATRIPSLTMSMPVTISVTQCSTWTRVFISRKKYVAVLVERGTLDRAGARRSRRRAPPRRRSCRCAPAARRVDGRRRRSPRSASGGGAGSSSRARRGGSRCRACRRAPGPRRGAGRGGSAPGRRRVAEDACASRLAPSNGAGSSSACGHDADALAAAAGRPPSQRPGSRSARRRARAPPSATSTSSRGAGHDRHARPGVIAARAVVLSPITSIASAGGPMKTMPVSAHGLGEGRVLGQEAVAGVDGLGAASGRPPRGSSRCRGSSRPRGRGRCSTASSALATWRASCRPPSRRPRTRCRAPAGTDDADGDLAAVGCQDLAEHRPRKLQLRARLSPEGAHRGGRAPGCGRRALPRSSPPACGPPSRPPRRGRRPGSRRAR